MEWRVIRLETRNAYSNMAVDNAIMEGIRAGSSAPTIRFYRWMPSAVSIGRFQSMNDEVNVEKCRELNISYVRRITGGGAVYHDSDGEITYSVIAPEREFPKNIIESYKLICGWVISGLAELGIEAEFAPINDITVNGKKISGNAQARSDSVLLQHGTVLYSTNIKRMFSVLKVSNEKISDKMIKSAEERVTRVVDHAGTTQEGLYEALLKGFTEGKEYQFDSLNGNETERARELEKSVYSSDSWNFSR
ncbi:MAG: lipoate--protein ligase family protein [Candidatus Marsarchaeota archaeon]|jgi:lipoate-protein ligase A|nr:lipoate--protein ligase family protein [Candidatus Marsarchaeota archaeon]MCL5111972.1 lipoate--protein ligase family protein [Candidatus Marsarchaeota archaeon]